MIDSMGWELERRQKEKREPLGSAQGKQAPPLRAELSTESSIAQIRDQELFWQNLRKCCLGALLNAGFAGKRERVGGILERELGNTRAEHGLQNVVGFLEELVGFAIALLGVFQMSA